MAKTKAHQKYRLVDGTIVPSVTTIIQELGWNKNALVAWARREALAGNDPNKVRDQAADVGSLVHALIEAHFKGTEVDLSEYSEQNINKAKTCFSSFLKWKENHIQEVWYSELQLVSETYRYGGTIDFVGLIDGVPSLMDFKSSSGVWPEYKIQVAAYQNLFSENFAPARLQGHLLQLDKNGDGFHHVVLGYQDKELKPAWEVFLHCLEIYKLKKMVC